MILTQQFKELVEDVKGDMTNGQGGTSSTLFLKTQTGLISAVAGTNIALIDLTNTDSSISATHQMGTAIGVGHNLIEFEINNGVDSYNRTVKAVYAKTSRGEYNVFHTFTFVVIV